MSDQNLNLSKRKKFIFTILMFFLPFFIFLFLELGLRVGNYGGNLDIFVMQEQNGKKQFVLNKNFTRRYFFKKGIEPPNPRTQLFSAKKDSNTYRIFCLGASTTQGVPYPPNAAFPAMLKNILMTLHPNKNFEVINCGVTAITSHSVLDMAREILDKYDPDLLVVYTGHNEFYGVFGLASRLSLFNSQLMIQSFLKLQRFRTFLLARDLYIKLLGEKITRESVVDPGTFMGTVAREAGIPINSKLFRRAEDHFKKNIESIIKVAKSNEKRIFLCTLVDNQKGLPPFESMYRPEDPPDSIKKYHHMLVKARKLMNDKMPRKALGILVKAVRFDSSYAETHYLLGQCYYILQNFVLARKHFIKAIDLDVIRFRAPSVFNKIMKSTCRSYAGILVDVEAMFENASPHGIVGNNLILEHIHPNERGYYLMARAIAQTMSKENLVSKTWDWTLDKSDSAYLAMNHLSLLSREIANAAVFRLTSHWPFHNRNKDRKYKKIGTDRTEELALAYLAKRQGSLVRMHLELGYEYFQKYEFDNALSEYLAALAIEPNCKGYNLLALLYSREVERKRKEKESFKRSLEYFQKALSSFNKGLSICPDDIELIYNRGVLYSMLTKGMDRAEESFQEVLKIDPHHKNARINLTHILLKKNKIIEAQENLIKGIEGSPGEAAFYRELGLAYFQQKKYVKAREMLTKAMMLKGKDPEIKLLLQKIESLQQ